jgi:lysophosphatidylcholine acyltransferase/lyso-PAF acetyltransferase
LLTKNINNLQFLKATIFVAAPHSSFFDAFLFFILDLPCVVSRIENTRIPILKIILRAVQPINVSRDDYENKLSVIEEIRKRATPSRELHLAESWPQLLIFPEGTTTNRSCLIKFKPGAFIPGLPVQPIAVKYNNKLDTITWTCEGFNSFKIILYTLCQFSNYMEVTYLPVYVPNEQEKLDANLFATNVRSKLAKLV